MVVLLGALGALASPVAAQTPPLSTDATLSSLELSEGRLDPAFATGTSDYAAAVGYTVTRLTVVPTTTDANATVAYLDGSDMALADASTVTDEQDVDLVVGETVVKVQITAQDTSTMLTYTVTITRTEEDTSLSPPASDPVAANPSTAVYDVVFQGAWTTAATPGGVPSGAHFSRLIGGVHSDAVTFLESGGTASAGVESMAEVGAWTGLQGEVQDAGSGALSVLAGDTDSISPATSKTLTATLTTEHPRVTLTTMVAPSPDWFVGVSGLPLLDADGLWLRSHEVHLYPWDAGTEGGSEFSLNNLATSPHGVITSIRGTGKFSTEPIASLSFALRSVSTTRSVAENTAAGVDIGAPVTATAYSGTVTYTLGGTDAASFDIVPSTGQLQTKAALDYETKSGYEVTVTATDTDGSVTTTVAIEVTNVIELTTFSGPTMVTFAENGATRVATFSYSSDEDRDGIEWLTSGVDRGLFSLDSPSGALRFLQAPDFENPLDVGPPGRGTDNSYELKLVAWARDSGPIFTDEVDVKVTVTDVDEAGALSLSSTRPALGAVLTAVLTDPDGATAGTAVWQWERSTGRNLWAVIEGAASASYTPVAADTNTFLRVTATYADEHGTGKAVSEVAPNVVTGPLLTGLTAETDDSQAAPARGLYPAFDPLTLHYGIGCDSTDTLVLTVSAAANARLAVAGVQAASAPMAVDVSEDSDVAIRVTDASGAGTTYVVHCLSEVFFEIEVHTFPNTDAFEDLILFSRDFYLRALDRNGVPRLRLDLGSGPGTFAVRFHRIGADGAYRYGFYRNSRFTVLNEDFEVVEDNVRTVGSSLRPINPHDFQILENGNYLLTANPEVMGDFRDFDLPSPAHGGVDLSSVAVWDQTIQIVTPAPGPQAVFTWGAWGNIAVEDCVQHRFPVTLSTDPEERSADPDISHANGAHIVDGVLAASLRGCSKVLGIDTATGDVVWRMGRTNLSDAEWAARDIGPRPLDFINDPEGEFCGQHSARILPNGNVFLFDNGSVCVIDPWTFEELGREGSDFSRAVEYALDLENHEAVFVRDHSLRGMRDYLGYANGTVFALDNGDWLVSWGRPLNVDVTIPDNEVATLVDPATGQEKLGLRFRELPASQRGRRINATVAPAEALALQPLPLTAEFPASEHTSLFHTGAGDSPEVVVAFSRPVVDFDETSTSLSVTGATVDSVSAHLVAGEPAHAYLVTLTPAGDGAISFRLVTGRACADDGICTADGTMLSEAPAALVIGPAVTVSFEQTTYSVTEGASRSVAVLLSSAHQGVRGVTIPVVRQQTTGSASADDLTLDESVTFEAGETRKSLALNALDDDLVEGDETATIEFDALPDGVTAGSTSTATLTLIDADRAQIDFTTGAPQVSEGGQTQLSFEITNAVTFEVDQMINLTVTGTATEGDDFTLMDAGNQTLSAPYAVTFPAGATSAEATIRAVDDSDIEPVAETITVEAWLALTNTSLGSLTITIPASDVPDAPVVTIARGNRVDEGTDATFTLSRTVTQSLPLSAPLTVYVEVTATGSTLGGSAPTTVRFEGGDATADLAVLTLDDSVVEPPGTVTALILGSTSNPPVYLTEPPNNATVTVNDNDVAAFTLSASNEEVAEGATVTVTIVADGVTFAGPQTITLTPGGTATPVDDFTLVDGGRELSNPYVVTLPAGARSVSVMIMAVTDSEDDADETIDLSVSHESSGIGSVTITITEAPIILPPVITGGGGGGGPSGPTPSDLDFEWNVTRDIEELDSGHDDPTGAWSDGATLWLLENGSGADDAIYAYDLASGERREDLEFELDDANLAPHGVWSDRTTIWISDSGKEKLFAHDLASGERLPDSDLALHPDNDDPRGIWSDGSTMWVLDGRDNGLFGYDLESGTLLAEYALNSDNDDPHGIWSDRVGVWVSDHNDNRLFAYRLPSLEDDTSEDAAGALELERVRDEEFTELPDASNNSPRGIWSDGDVMYVADDSDGKVYSYNVPDAIDARLSSLALSGVDVGEFDRNRTDYEGAAGEDVTETTVTAEALQRRTDVDIDPPDADVEADGHQVALEDLTEITVTVTSADGSRKKAYRVRLSPEEAAGPAPEEAAGPAPDCLRGAVAVGFSLVVYEGGNIEDLEACAEGRNVTALYTLEGGEFVSYILGAPGFVNEDFRALFADGVPALTPLTVKSDGPATAAPVPAVVVAESWPECLRGEIAAGFSLVLYQGG